MCVYIYIYIYYVYSYICIYVYTYVYIIINVCSISPAGPPAMPPYPVLPMNKSFNE